MVLFLMLPHGSTAFAPSEVVHLGEGGVRLYELFTLMWLWVLVPGCGVHCAVYCVLPLYIYQLSRAAARLVYKQSGCQLVSCCLGYISGRCVYTSHRLYMLSCRQGWDWLLCTFLWSINQQGVTMTGLFVTADTQCLLQQVHDPGRLIHCFNNAMA